MYKYLHSNPAYEKHPLDTITMALEVSVLSVLWVSLRGHHLHLLVCRPLMKVTIACYY